MSKDIFLYVAITDFCNLSCKHCYYFKKKNKKIMDINTFNSIISQVKKTSIKNIIFFGGEPLTHPDILKMLKLCKKNNLRIEIATNGKLYAKIPKIHKYIDSIRISIHSLNPEKHNEIEKESNWLNALKSINTARKHKINVNISSCIFNINKDDIFDLIFFALKYKVKGIQILPHYRDKNSYKNAVKLAKLLDKIGINNNFIASCFSYDRNHKKCLALLNRMIYIDTEGYLYRCPYSKFVLGNINNLNLKVLLEKEFKKVENRNNILCV